MNRPEEFLKELAELTKKYGMSIGGCGCCHSPWIWDIKKETFAAEDLIYDEKKQEYKLGDEDEFEDDEFEDDEDEDEAEYEAFCKQFLNADEKWKLVKG